MYFHYLFEEEVEKLSIQVSDFSEFEIANCFCVWFFAEFFFCFHRFRLHICDFIYSFQKQKQNIQKRLVVAIIVYLLRF